MRYLDATDHDPQGDLWADPAFVDAYFAALIEAHEGDDAPVDEDEPGTPEWDPIPELVMVTRRARALCAATDRAFAETLREAEADPEFWVGPDPTVDPLWVDPRGRSATQVRAWRRNLAVRAAAADVAVQVHLSDTQVRARAHRADTLQSRCPRVWDAYLAGDVSEQNAATAATLAAALPVNPDAWAAFDDLLTEPAARLAPGKFRTRARVTWERVHPETLAYRHARAVEDREVRFTPELDGMASITAFMAAVNATRIQERIEDHAQHLHAQSGETRTLAQLRADVFTDLLTADASIDAGANADANTVDAGAEDADADANANNGTSDANVDADGANARGTKKGKRRGSRITTTIHLTIPTLSLLGQSTEPAILDGYGPIPLDQARQLAEGAEQWVRVLTHPIDSTVLDVERRTYRIPKSLRRWLGIRRPVCPFPGCQKPAKRCDIDHRRRWADGGTTSAHNNDPFCENHHIIKDETLWRVDRDPVTGKLTFTSPTGVTVEEDPPPF